MAATKKGAEDSILSPKAKGTALFLEFTRSSGTQQIIIVSEATLEGKYYPPSILLRQVTEEAKRRPWDQRTAQASTEKDVGARSAEYLKFFSKWLQASFAGAGWVRKEGSYAVEITAQDVADLADSKTPQGLIQRIAATEKLIREEI